MKKNKKLIIPLTIMALVCGIVALGNRTAVVELTHEQDSKILDRYITSSPTNMSVIESLSNAGINSISCGTVYESGDVNHNSPIRLDCHRSSMLDKKWLTIIIDKNKSRDYGLSYPYSNVLPRNDESLDVETTAKLLSEALVSLSVELGKSVGYSANKDKIAESFGVLNRDVNPQL